MAITFEKVIQQVLNRLSAVAGATAVASDASYTGSPSTSTVIGPDFVPSTVNDSVAATLSEIVEAIASTPLHPERQRFADVTVSLANRAAIPRVGAGTGKTIIGLPGFVRDAVDSKALLPVELDKVRSFTEFSGTVYSGFAPYWFAVNGNRIEHTRTNAVIEVCVYTRPTTFAGNIDIDDWNEGGLVWGAVAKLALKESMFSELFAGANAAWQSHLAQIRSYQQPALYGRAQAAPSSI